MTRMADQDEEVKKAIKVILADEESYKTSLNYAVGYCQLALSLYGDALAVQCLYILNNISHWRGPGSKEARAALKLYVKLSGK